MVESVQGGTGGLADAPKSRPEGGVVGPASASHAEGGVAGPAPAKPPPTR